MATLLRDTLESPWVVTAADILHWDEAPRRAQRAAWVALDGENVVGWGDAQVRWEVSEEGVCELWCAVAREGRRRGIGSALFEHAWEHLLSIGALVVETWAEEDAGRRFVRARGFEETRQDRISSLDPREADLSGLAELKAVKGRDGFRVVPLGQVLDQPRELFQLYMAGEADLPGTFAEDNVAFAEWEKETLGLPSLDPDGSSVVVYEGRPVALAWLEVDREGKRATNEMTATLPEFRRRGLARLAKLASIQWAAEKGITSMVTSNDGENPGMLALNDSLGYRTTVWRGRFTRGATGGD